MRSVTPKDFAQITRRARKSWRKGQKPRPILWAVSSVGNHRGSASTRVSTRQARVPAPRRINDLQHGSGNVRATIGGHLSGKDPRHEAVSRRQLSQLKPVRVEKLLLRAIHGVQGYFVNAGPQCIRRDPENDVVQPFFGFTSRQLLFPNLVAV